MDSNKLSRTPRPYTLKVPDGTIKEFSVTPADYSIKVYVAGTLRDIADYANLTSREFLGLIVSGKFLQEDNRGELRFNQSIEIYPNQEEAFAHRCFTCRAIIHELLCSVHPGYSGKRFIQEVSIRPNRDISDMMQAAVDLLRDSISNESPRKPCLYDTELLTLALAWLPEEDKDRLELDQLNNEAKFIERVRKAIDRDNSCYDPVLGEVLDSDSSRCFKKSQLCEYLSMWMLESIGREHGWSKDSGVGVIEFLEARLSYAASKDAEAVIQRDLREARAIVLEIKTEIAANVEAAEEGRTPTRVGIPRESIAATLKRVAEYVTKKNIGPEHNELAADWIRQPDGLIAQISRASQIELGEIFGGGFWPSQGAYKNIVRILKLLSFFSYRDSLDGIDSGASALIEEVRAFRGDAGSLYAEDMHPLNDERSALIASTARHHSERYVEPCSVRPDHLNAVHMAFNWTEKGWIPENAGTILCRFNLGNERTYNDHSGLAKMKASLREGFRIGEVTASVDVELGNCYGQDSVVVRMSRAEYLDKYLAIKRGDLKVENVPKCGDRPRYYVWGYGSQSNAFFGPGGLYIRKETLESIDSENQLTQKVKWLRSTTLVSESEVVVPNASGGNDQFVVFKERWSGIPIKIGNRYWDATDLGNEIRRVISHAQALANGFIVSEKQETEADANQADLESLTDWFEYEGNFYIPKTDPFKQVAYHFKAKHGVANTWVISLKSCANPEGLKTLLNNKLDKFWLLLTNESDHIGNSGVVEKLRQTLSLVAQSLKEGRKGQIDLN
jgi:hypothetical protein